MTIFKHELKQGRNSLIIWTASVSFLILVCVLMFPQMKGEMEDVGEMFSSMGSFTQAFGMDQLNFGTLIGFYGIECGNILGLGGAFFAALCAVSMLAKEEKEHTAEFLLTHPVSRGRVVTEKFASIIAQIVFLNLFVLAAAVVSVGLIGEEIPWKEILLLHFAYFLLQVQIAGICFGISAFLHRGSLGIGLGLAALLYFLNLIANISETADFLKYFTPFGYAEASDIIASGGLCGKFVSAGAVFFVMGVTAAYVRYLRKDL